MLAVNDMMIIFIHWSDKKTVTNERKRKENLTNLIKEIHTQLNGTNNTVTHNITMTLWSSIRYYLNGFRCVYIFIFLGFPDLFIIHRTLEWLSAFGLSNNNK